MTPAAFWRLVNQAASRLNPEHTLRKALRRLTAEQVAGYQRQFQAHLEKAYCWDLWGASSLRNEDPAQELFVFFLYDLIAHGKLAYARALANADSIVKTTVFQNEEFGTIAHEIYDEKTRKPLPNAWPPRGKKPAGKRWRFDDPTASFERLPKLYEEYAWPRFETLFEEGHELSERRKDAEANKRFRAALAIIGEVRHPGVPVAHGNLMRGEAALGNLAAARKHMKLALATVDHFWRQHGENRAWLENEIAWFLYQHGTKAELPVALEHARRALRSKDVLPAMDTQMRILLRMGRDDDARAVAKRALRLNPRHRDFQDVKKRWKL